MEPGNIEILAYDDLQSPEVSLEVIQILIYSSNWLDNFTALRELRSLNKFAQPLIAEHWTAFGGKIVQFIDSPRSFLSRHTLVFICEIFEYRSVDLEEILSSTLPILLIKSNNEKAFIKELACKAIDATCKSMFSEKLVRILGRHCFNKSRDIAYLAFSKLNVLFEQFEKTQLLGFLVGLIGCNKSFVINGTRTWINLLKEWEGYSYAIQTLTDEQRTKLIRFDTVKPKQHVGKFKDFIQSKKKENVRPDFHLIE